jgi:hypothetical protein
VWLTRRGPLIVKSEGEVVNLWLLWCVSYLSVRSASRADECAALVASRICTIRWWREEWGACLLQRRKRGLGGRRRKGVGVMRDKELKLDDDWVIQWVTEIQWMTMNMAVQCFIESLNRHVIQSHACSVIHWFIESMLSDTLNHSQWITMNMPVLWSKFSESLNRHGGTPKDVILTQMTHIHAAQVVTISTIKHATTKLVQKLRTEKGHPKNWHRSQAAPRANCTFFFLWPITTLRGLRCKVYLLASAVAQR